MLKIQNIILIILLCINSINYARASYVPLVISNGTTAVSNVNYIEVNGDITYTNLGNGEILLNVNASPNGTVMSVSSIADNALVRGNGGGTGIQGSGIIVDDNNNISNINNLNVLNYSLLNNVDAINLFSQNAFINGTLTIPTGSSTGLVLTSDANGVATWQAFPSIADNLGSHIAGTNLNLNGFSLINAQDVNGITANFTNGNFTNITTNTLFSQDSIFNGNISIPTGSATGLVLTSDANGLATWQAISGVSNGGINNATILSSNFQDSTFNGLNFFTNNSSLQINGNLIIPNGATTGFVLTTDANGLATWQAIPSSADNLGSHIAGTNLNLNGFSLINAQDVNGVSANFVNGNFTSISTEILGVNGNLFIPYGSNAGFVLTSDINGNASWTDLSSLSTNGDNLGNHIATTNINLNGNNLINVQQIDINGSLIYRNGASTGYVLTSDANGLANWQAIAGVSNGTISNATILSSNFQDSIFNGSNFFTNNSTLQINGNLFIPAGATTGLVLTSDANGLATWQAIPSSADDLGSHIAGTNLNLNGFSLINAQDINGVTANFNNGNFSDLNISSSFTFTNGAANGLVLVSDANGVASWQIPPTVTASGANGAIQFSLNGVLASDENNFFYDHINGNLGLGTNNPNFALEIDKDNPTIYLNNNGGTSNDHPIIRWNSNSDALGLRFYSGATEVARVQDNRNFQAGSFSTFGGMNIGDFFVQRGSTDAAITMPGAGIITIGRGAVNGFSLPGNEYARFDDGGNLGLLTTTPSALLDIGGGIRNFTDGIGDALIADDLEVDGNLYVNGTLATSLTPRSVIFAGANGTLSDDNNSFVWDSTNNRLGIGNSSPSYQLDINGHLQIASPGGPSLFTSSNATTFTFNTQGGAGTSNLRVGSNNNSSTSIYAHNGPINLEPGPYNGVGNNYQFNDTGLFARTYNLAEGDINSPTYYLQDGLDNGSPGITRSNLLIGTYYQDTQRPAIQVRTVDANNSFVGFSNNNNFIPSAKVHVQNGDLYITNGSLLTEGFAMPTGAANGLVLVSDANGVASWQIPPTVTASGANGAIQFSEDGMLSSNGNAFFWDINNGRLGIGTNTPNQALDVRGNINLGANQIVAASGSSWQVSNTYGFQIPGPSARVHAANSQVSVDLDSIDFAIHTLGDKAQITTNGLSLLKNSPEEALDVNGQSIFRDRVYINSLVINPEADLEVGNGTADFIDGNSDILIADDLEVDGDTYIQGNLVVSNGVNLQDAVLNGRTLFTNNSIAQFNGGIFIPSGAAEDFVLTSDANGVATWQIPPAVAASGINGAIQFSEDGVLSSNGNSFFWDINNGRLGIGTNNPSTALEVNGALTINTMQGLNNLRVVAEPFGEPIYSAYLGGTRAFGIRSNATLELGTPGMRTQGGAINIGVNGGQRIDRSNSFIVDFSNTSNEFAFQSGHSSEAVGRSAFVFDTERSLSTSDVFQIRENGNNLFIVDSNGNIGIGTNTTTTPLSVNGTTYTEGFIMPTGAANGLVLVSDANGVATWQVPPTVTASGANGAIQFSEDGVLSSNGNSFFWDINNGRLGIGTNNPTQDIEVNGNIIVTNGVFGTNYIGASGGIHGALSNRRLSLDDGTFVDPNGNGFGSQGWSFEAAGGGYEFTANSISRMLITNSGRIGINNINPNAMLAMNISNGIEQGLTLRAFNNQTANLLELKDNGGSTITTFDNGGFLGIGFSDPIYNLAVNGTTYTEGLIMPTGAANGLVLVSDANGVASWQVPPTVTASGANGAIQFSLNGVLASDENNFFWDNNNKRMGIGINNSLNGKLHVVSANAMERTAVFQGANGQTANLSEWKDTNGTTLLSIEPSGNIRLGPIGAASGRRLVSGYSTGNYLDLNQVSPVLASGATSWPLRLISTNSGVRISSNNSIDLIPTTSNTLSFYSPPTPNSSQNASSPSGTLAHLEASSASFNGVAASNIQLTVQAASSQTANLTEWQDDNATILSIIDNDGYMAIGRSTIDRVNGSALHVNGSIFSTGFRLQDGNQANGLVLVSDANGVASWQVPPTVTASGANGAIQFSEDGVLSSNGNAFYWDINNGRLGIGNNNPQYTLEVGSQASLTYPARLRINDVSDNQQLIFANGNQNRFIVRNSGAVLGFLSQDTSPAGVGQSFLFTGGTPDTGHLGSLFRITGNYNNAGQRIDGLDVNITNTNSAANSSLANFQTNGNSKLFVDVSGNVGINDTTPNSMLAINVSNGTEQGLTLHAFNGQTANLTEWTANNSSRRISIGSLATNDMIRLYSNNNAHRTTLHAMGDFNSQMIEGTYDGNQTFLINYDPSFGVNTGNIISYGSRAGSIYAPGYEARLHFRPRGLVTNTMTLDENGNVGIGLIANPNTRLDINGSIAIRDGSEANGFVLTSDANGVASWQAISNTSTASGANGSIQFALNGSLASDSTNFHWDNINNRLGLGTNTPTTTLEVNGALTFTAEVNNGVSGAGITIDFSSSNKQRVVLDANTTLTLNAPGVGNYLLKVVQDATGSRTATWAAASGAIRWPSGIAPTLSSTANAVDIVSCYYDGTDYFCLANLNFI